MPEQKAFPVLLKGGGLSAARRQRVNLGDLTS